MTSLKTEILRKPGTMKIFPENDYLIELNEESTSAIYDLKNHTLSKEQFVTNWNYQTFIGEVKENGFEIQLSKRLFGEFCILTGKLDNRNGKLKIQTGKIFKIIFSVIFLFSCSGIIVGIIQNKLEFILYVVITVLIIRYIFLEVGFRLASESMLNKLTEIIGIKNKRRITAIR